MGGGIGGIGVDKAMILVHCNIVSLFIGVMVIVSIPYPFGVLWGWVKVDLGSSLVSLLVYSWVSAVLYPPYP